jgi:hypothetical protein
LIKWLKRIIGPSAREIAWDNRMMTNAQAALILGDIPKAERILRHLLIRHPEP